MQKVDLEKNDIIDKWLSAKKKSENTRKSYLQGMYFYTELLKKTPDELIEEARAEQRSGVWIEDRKIQEYFDDYLEFLEGRNLAPKTIHGYIGAIRSFYKKKHIEVPDLDLKKAKSLKKNKGIPTKEDLQDVLNACGLLEKAIVLTGVSSGLSDIDIVNLKISEFKKGYDPVNKIASLRLTRGKLGETADTFITFLSPEATKAINDYLTKHRDREPKTNFQRDRDRLDKQKVVSDDGYLFIKKHVRNSYLLSGDEEERKISPSNLIQIFRYISENAKKNTPFGDWNLIRSHNMRRYFYNVMMSNKCPHDHLEHMMGHVLYNVKDSYFVPIEEQLKKSYIDCIPYLTVQKELDISESPYFQNMKEENEYLKAENYRVNVERDEIQRLSADIENYKNEMQIKSEIERNKHSIQLLKMQKKLHPEKTGEIQKMIEGLQNASNHMHNKLYKEYEKYREDVEEPELLNES